MTLILNIIHCNSIYGALRSVPTLRSSYLAGWRPGDPLVGGDLWDSGGEPRNTAEPIRHRRDDDCDQRRPRRGAVGVRGHYAQEPAEWYHPGMREQHHTDLLPRPTRHDWRRRRGSQRYSRRSTA